MIGWVRRDKERRARDRAWFARHATDVGQPPDPDPLAILAAIAVLFLVLALVGWAYYGVR